MIELKPFQSTSAKMIAERYSFYAGHPDRPRKGNKPRPFFQALSALTGAGKTPILAQAVTHLRAYFGVEPIVLWMSKAKSVVGQTYTNFLDGGKYSHIIEDFRVIRMSELHPEFVSDGTIPLLLITTTGLFNSKDQADGALHVYKKGNDLFGDRSPWERLIERSDGKQRRPLLIVYDEGHNLSPQQTELLAELEPDAYLLASATLELPASFQKSVIQPITLWVEEINDSAQLNSLDALDAHGAPDAGRFSTSTISSKAVVNEGLVKKAIQFDGTTAAMEHCLDDLIHRMSLIQTEIDERKLGFKPKAIYVCKTNIADDGEKDDSSKPFEHRQAPPIRIWRYLVEEKGISPDVIAIYADLTFQKGTKPAEVNLFSKKENDFDEFQAGDYQHIIFNLGLQEGWDDPACYLAYIDKSMGSTIQVQQIIGRVLRQYGAVHYGDPFLDSAHFFLRVDKESVFTDALSKVKAKLKAEGSPIEITSTFGKSAAEMEELHPKDDTSVDLHEIFVDSEAARERIVEILGDFPSFPEGDPNTLGHARASSEIVELNEPGKTSKPLEWVSDGYTNPMRLRWLVNTAIKARSTRALGVLDLKDPKFDVRVQIQSTADKLTQKVAREIVEAFYQHSELAYESVKPYKFGVIRTSKKSPEYVNGLYERYTTSNAFEKRFADALDSLGLVWHRNPSSGGFFIPLLSEGETGSFYPDFIVWKKGLIYCLDTKGGHLISDAVARKLFDIKEDGKTKMQVRFVTEGKQSKLQEKAVKGGYTVWKSKNGSPTPLICDSLEKGLAECLR